MDKKTLLAEAVRKLDRQQQASNPLTPISPALPEASSEAIATERKKQPLSRGERVVSKGITLRPSNLEKLDKLELSLRKQGIKAGHSGLIQIAIDLLEDNARLASAYRELLKLDLRLK
jgi:hypothetical protein